MRCEKGTRNGAEFGRDFSRIRFAKCNHCPIQKHVQVKHQRGILKPIQAALSCPREATRTPWGSLRGSDMGRNKCWKRVLLAINEAKTRVLQLFYRRLIMKSLSPKLGLLRAMSFASCHVLKPAPPAKSCILSSPLGVCPLSRTGFDTCPTLRCPARWKLSQDLAQQHASIGI